MKVFRHSDNNNIAGRPTSAVKPGRLELFLVGYWRDCELLHALTKEDTEAPAKLPSDLQ